MRSPIFILGGYQTDFKRHIAREGLELFDLVAETATETIAACDIEPAAIDSAHVGNFTAELFAGQGHLGGMLASVHPDLAGKPAARHEAACASGGVAMMAAAAEIAAGFAGTSLVVGVELMRNVDGQVAADHLGAAAFRGREGTEARYLWPHMFSRVADEVDRRFGLDRRHLCAIAELNFANAKRNPRAQSRAWTLSGANFSEDDRINPVIEGRLRRHDCGQITDGGSGVVLASAEAATKWASARGRKLETVPRITGWGHRTGTLTLESKLEAAADGELLFPHVRDAIRDAQQRAGLGGVDQLSGIELHDCFTITEYVLLDHFELCAPGDAWKVIERGDIGAGGKTPVNPSGGLIGCGHPVGASGVRMALDAARQVSGGAGDYQVPGAHTFQTLNIGGSATTAVSFVVQAGASG